MHRLALQSVVALALLGCSGARPPVRPPDDYRIEEPRLGPEVLFHDPSARPRFEMRLDPYPPGELPLSRVEVEWLPAPCDDGCAEGLSALAKLPEVSPPQPLATPDGLVQPIQSRLQPLLSEDGPVARIECRPRRFEAQRAGENLQLRIILDVRIGPEDGPSKLGMTTAHEITLSAAPMDDAELLEIERFVAIQAFDRLVFAGQLLDGLGAVGGAQLERGVGESANPPAGSQEI